MSVNVIVLTGRMTKDPELKYTPSGLPTAQFTLAVDRNTKPDEQGNKETDWIPCVLWRQQAEFAANYLGKGALVAVEGRLQVRKYQTQDGQNRTFTEVVCNRITPMQSKKDREAAGAAPDVDPDAHDPFKE